MRKRKIATTQAKFKATKETKHDLKKNIAEMLRSLRAPTDAESASGCYASSESDSDLDESGNG